MAPACDGAAGTGGARGWNSGGLSAQFLGEFDEEVVGIELKESVRVRHEVGQARVQVLEPRVAGEFLGLVGAVVFVPHAALDAARQPVAATPDGDSLRIEPGSGSRDGSACAWGTGCAGGGRAASARPRRGRAWPAAPGSGAAPGPTDERRWRAAHLAVELLGVERRLLHMQGELQNRVGEDAERLLLSRDHGRRLVHEQNKNIALAGESSFIARSGAVSGEFGPQTCAASAGPIARTTASTSRIFDASASTASWREDGIEREASGRHVCSRLHAATIRKPRR